MAFQILYLDLMKFLNNVCCHDEIQSRFFASFLCIYYVLIKWINKWKLKTTRIDTYTEVQIWDDYYLVKKKKWLSIRTNERRKKRTPPRSICKHLAYLCVSSFHLFLLKLNFLFLLSKPRVLHIYIPPLVFSYCFRVRKMW